MDAVLVCYAQVRKSAPNRLGGVNNMALSSDS